MGSFRFDRLLEYTLREGFLLGLFWLGLAAFSIALVALMGTRWGKSRPLGKCLALSLLAHLLFAGCATMIPVVPAPIIPVGEDVVHVSMEDSTAAPARATEDPAYREEPWEALAEQRIVQAERIELARAEMDQALEVQRRELLGPAELPPDTPLQHLGLDEAVQPEPESLSDTAPAASERPASRAEAVEAPRPERRQGARTTIPLRPVPERTTSAGSETDPTRRRRAGLPSSLFPRRAPLPRLADQSPTLDPQDMLPGFQDVLPPPHQGRPAEATGVASASNARHSNPDLPSRGDSGKGRSGRMSQPSLAATVGRPQAATTPSGMPPGSTPLIGPPQLALRHRGGKPSEMPEIYRLRVAPDRAELAKRRGATAETEEAVKAALKWLAANQEADGRWSARRHGAGRELMVAGRDRQAAGLNADTGITGLSLLALLASGHTQLEGEYQPNVRRGLDYLVKIQGADGNLGGRATTFSFMYCHAMATFAMSEAYAMTKDERLAKPVRRAIAYTLAAQDTTSGGWRYKPGDPGDTSQLGWQLMALKSAEIGGIPIPQRTRKGILRFLGSASSGQFGGLVAYRPTEQPSRAMTAEALVCRQFLGSPPNSPASREAANYLLGELPGRGEPNLYYWYYATLGMYQMQGIHWRRWNDSLQTTLLARQQKTGLLAGSWNPDTRWAGYGGRVYSTALATLCLEVYYRFLPLYVEAAPAQRTSP